jgi:ELWxxDGT repeat protein
LSVGDPFFQIESNVASHPRATQVVGNDVFTFVNATARFGQSTLSRIDSKDLKASNIVFASEPQFLFESLSLGDRLVFSHGPMDDFGWIDRWTLTALDPLTDELTVLRQTDDPSEWLLSLTELTDQTFAFLQGSWHSSGRRSVWLSNGKENGTERLALPDDVIPFRIVGGNESFVFFIDGDEETHAVSLDGVVTRLGDRAHAAVEAYGRSLFLSSTSENLELWSFDGEVTSHVTALDLPSNTGLAQYDMEVMGSELLITDGERLYVSDGTQQGTRLIRDYGVLGRVSDLIPFGRRMFFAADDGIHGTELWRTDGTTQGTRLEHDIMPGPGGSFPNNFVQSVDQLFFSADDGVHGRELFSFVRDLRADVNEDGVVDFVDFLVLSNNFGRKINLEESRALGDLNGSGMVDFEDFLILSDEYRG